MSELEAWEPLAVLRERMKTLRKRHGLTQQGLADKLADQGSPIDRASVGKIESGTRGVSVNEAVAIALALDVSPAHLLVPDDPVLVTVGKWIISSDDRFAQWIRGGRALPSQDDRNFESMIPRGAWDVDPVGADAIRDAVRRLEKIADETEERQIERREQNQQFLEWAHERGLVNPKQEESE